MCFWLNVCFGVQVIEADNGLLSLCVFFFQAEDGIRDAQESRGLGDVYKRQEWMRASFSKDSPDMTFSRRELSFSLVSRSAVKELSLIHI